jgi:DNA recombination protein RmuC
MPVESILLLIVAIQAVCLVTIAVAWLWRSRRSSDVADALRQMAQSLQEEQTRQAVIAERVQGVQPMAHHLGVIRAGLAELRAYTRARQDVESETRQAIHRLEAVISGNHAKGAAGEHLLDAIFSQLPVSWQVRNYRVGNKMVEFGLLLPNGLILPIDSKWAATPLLEQFLAADEGDSETRARLRAQIEAAVLERAREVTKYLDPNVTAGFGLAVVPDAVFGLCRGAQAQALASQVALVSHSLFLPYLLLVYETTLQASRSVDLQRLSAYLHSSQASIRVLQEELEGRFARALTMLDNSRGHMAGELSKVQAELTSLTRTAEQMAQGEQER